MSGDVSNFVGLIAVRGTREERKDTVKEVTFEQSMEHGEFGADMIGPAD